MTHPLVTQLQFARSEFVRGLQGLSAEDAVRRFEPMNCISWIIGHLAAQEQFLWVYRAQERIVDSDLYLLVGTGRPATTPPLDDMWSRWQAIAKAADEYLEAVTVETLWRPLHSEGPSPESVGISLLRNTYHYWFHLGEAMAVRQMLGHTGVPEFVGNMAAVKV